MWLLHRRLRHRADASRFRRRGRPQQDRALSPRPADSRDDADHYELIGNDQGIFGCMSLMGCEDLCPKELPLQAQLAWLRRGMARQGLRGIFDKRTKK